MKTAQTGLLSVMVLLLIGNAAGFLQSDLFYRTLYSFVFEALLILKVIDGYRNGEKKSSTFLLVTVIIAIGMDIYHFLV